MKHMHPIDRASLLVMATLAALVVLHLTACREYSAAEPTPPLLDAGAFAWAQPGDITFDVGGREVLRLKSDGAIIVNGKAITQDVQLVRALRRFVEGNRCEP